MRHSDTVAWSIEVPLDIRWHDLAMVAGIHFFATDADEARLLDHLGEPDTVRIFPWVPMPLGDATFLGRHEIQSSARLGILNLALGEVALVRPGEQAFSDPFKAAVLNRLNWERFRPQPSDGIVDWNVTPALFWSRGSRTDDVLTPSELGSQADSMTSISDDYRRWVNRSMSWVRRVGTKVWTWGSSGGESQFDVNLSSATTYYALPGAIEFLKAGGLGRSALRRL